MNVNFFWATFFHFLFLVLLTVGIFLAARGILPEYLAIAATVAIATALAWLLTRRVSRPLQILNERMGRMAAGDIRRMKMIMQQKNEQDAVFSSMGEGVVALNHDERILHINRAALQILGVSHAQLPGRSIVEVVRLPEIINLIRGSMADGESRELDLDLPDGSVRFLQVRTTPLMNAESDKPGLVLVLSDVTRMRELEGMRRNFVANVSHELRTPLTSIQGFAETILNPAVKNPEEIKKFVEIIRRHAERLGRIIEDILTLSRIEKDDEQNQIDVQISHVLPVLKNAVELCTIKARMKKIDLKLECAPDLTAKIDVYLLEQAVINLIDNAIRYSDSDAKVTVAAVNLNVSEVQISVKDEGIGIPEKHHARIFERFYRVDKARSREVGGTGLGLSIVKHIAVAHRGRVEVHSIPGQGSTFSIIVPR
jgi:two-component system, OmpR family, phosphate regulon sensor histidine kinase PhoR